MKKLIKYSISKDYISDWGYWEAVREIVQNFRDYGEFKDEVNIIDNQPRIVYSNEFRPEGVEFLKVGFSQKGSKEAVGKHGEGLKMALLVLNRLGLSPVIEIATGLFVTVIKPVFYDDEHLGECFGIEVDQVDTTFSNSDIFTLSFDYDDEQHNTITDNFLTSENTIFECERGRIVDKPDGNIYVGGIYVTHYSLIKDRAYDLNPSQVDLGRDRDFPNTWDLEYNVSKIFQEFLDENPDAFNSANYTESCFVEKVPEEIMDNIETRVLGGDIVLVHKDTKKQINSNFNSVVKKDPRIQEEFKHRKASFNKRKTPLMMLLEFKEKYNLSYEAKLELQDIIDRLDV